jgi:hypothetical protein
MASHPSDNIFAAFKHKMETSNNTFFAKWDDDIESISVGRGELHQFVWRVQDLIREDVPSDVFNRLAFFLPQEVA